MELTPTGAIPEPYMQLLPCLLAPVLWDRPANISPLVRLLSAFATQAAPQIVAQDKLVMLRNFCLIFIKNCVFRADFWVYSKS